MKGKVFHCSIEKDDNKFLIFQAETKSKRSRSVYEKTGMDGSKSSGATVSLSFPIFFLCIDPKIS